MKIAPYREIPDKKELLPLMSMAFGWPYNPQKFEEIAEIDPRLKSSPIGFCMLENSKPVGFVGVMDLQTKTIEGHVETVGGIWGVTTSPGHTRRGIATALMRSAHNYFDDKGYRFSFLLTARTIIAYAFYRKLGYKDATDFPSAHKIIEGKKKPSGKGKEESKEVDWEKVVEIYNRFAADKAGFTVRDKKYFEVLRKREKIKPERIFLGENGYVIFKENEEAVFVNEIIALTTEEARNLISFLERKGKPIVCDRTVLDEKILGVYESLGYMIRKKSHDLLMVKELTKKKTFSQVYGGKFYMTNLDFF